MSQTLEAVEAVSYKLDGVHCDLSAIKSYQKGHASERLSDDWACMFPRRASQAAAPLSLLRGDDIMSCLIFRYPDSICNRTTM